MSCCEEGSFILKDKKTTKKISNLTLDKKCLNKTIPIFTNSYRYKFSYHTNINELKNVYDNFETSQIFIDGSSISKNKTCLVEDNIINTINNYLVNDKSIVVHAPLNLNLCKFKDSFTKMISYLDSTNKLKNSSLVCHIGSNPQKDKGINFLTDNLNSYIQKGQITKNKNLLLEISAGQGNSIGSSFEELRNIKEKLDNSSVGICIDTQHAFASNMCDFSQGGTVLMLDAFLDLDLFPQCIHLNDSYKGLNSKLDRHAPLGKGHIWKEDFDSLFTLLDYCNDYKINIITETKDSISDMNIINSFLDSV